jgi:ATP synthase protein I
MEQGRDSKPAEQPRSSAYWDGADQGMRVLSYLIAGVCVYGLLGWLGDHLLGTGFLLPVGIVLGAAASIYTIIRRFGQVPDAPPSSSPARRRLRRPSEEYALSRRGGR